MKSTIYLLGIISIIFMVGCTATVQNSQDTDNAMEGEEMAEKASPAWVDILLEDVKTGEKFRVSDFEGKDVLVESFATWCPSCTKQQGIMTDLHEESDVVTIAINTDPNEDKQKVLEHIERGGFESKYVIASRELTQMLIDEYGVTVANAPAVPVIQVCENGETKLLPRGVKTVSVLESAIAAC